MEKKAKCNKLLRKAVQLGDIVLVELILTNAAGQGRNTHQYLCHEWLSGLVLPAFYMCSDNMS